MLQLNNGTAPVRGMECAAAFDAAEDGFFEAPDCGTTAGNWTDDSGFTYVLTGGGSRGSPQDFTGTVNFNHNSGCAGNALGTRTGSNNTFTEPAPSVCGPSPNNYGGMYNDCNKAGSTWFDANGYSGTWTWNRTNTVDETGLLSRLKVRPQPTDK